MKMNKEVGDKFDEWMRTEFKGNIYDVGDYLYHLLDAIYQGGVQYVKVGGKTYEVCADIMETEE